MFKFLKHNWTKREKLFARWGAQHLALAVAAGVLAAGVLTLWQMGKDQTRVGDLRTKAAQVQPATQTPPGTKTIGGNFDLLNQDRKPVKDADYRGKFMLVYFGYTYCPDMCPTGLQSMAHALDQLGAEADKIAPLFITIDPARDTAEKLKTYVADFHPRIEGLTGSEQQVAAAAAAYQVYYAKGEKVDERDYVMDHSSMIYLMGPDGTLITTFPEDVDPAAIVKAVKEQSAGQKKP
jgi:cytochrome oxidase Cu insertion factor (SCO1/SenC/PrrC family)